MFGLALQDKMSEKKLHNSRTEAMTDNQKNEKLITV